MRTLATLVVIVACLTASWAVGGEAALNDKARMLLDYQSFMRGDRDGAVRFCLNASRELQGTPLAELAVRIALFYDPASLSSVAVGEAEARRILGSDSSDLAGEYRDLLRRFIARNLAAAGRRAEAMEVHRRRGLAMSWLVAGPFTGRGASNFESREFPETGDIFNEDVIKNPPDAERFRQWRRNPPWRALPENRAFPYVRPWRQTGLKDEGAMLLFTGLEMKEGDNRAVFHIFCETSWRLYVDGALVAEIDRSSRETPSEHLVPFSLTSGVHAVTLQVFPPGVGMEMEQVRTAVRLEADVPFAWNRDAVKPQPITSSSSRRDARRMKYLTDLAEARNQSPNLKMAYALACLEQGMRDEAAWWGETAAREAGNDVTLQFLAGVLTSLNPLLPDERRRDFATAWHRRALASNPDLVQSLLFLAKNASDAGRVREANEYLNRASALNPVSLDVSLAMGEWARKYASGSTARMVWDECSKAFPHSSIVQLSIASMPQDGFLDMNRRLEACRAAVEAGPYVPEASLKLAEALADSGNAQEAASVLRNALELFAGEVGVVERISTVYSRLSMYPEAMAALEEAVRLTPDNYLYWRRLGDLCMDSGDDALAKKYWRVSLAANPGQFELVDMLDFLSGSPNRLYNEGGYDAIAITAAVNPAVYSGDVVRLLDRSVLMFAEDGSYRRLTHEIDLARTRRGGETLTGIDSPGELLTARIVFPNGNTLEPEPYPGNDELRLPVIMPGAARELRVLEAAPVEGRVQPVVMPWFFQDPLGRVPFLLSEYVVRTPRNFPLVYVVRNLGSNVEFEFTQEEDADVYRWTAKLNMPSREPDAVHVSERVPSVEVGMKTSWDDIVFYELRQFEGRLVPSMRMRMLLDSLMQTTPDGRPDPLQSARAIYRYVCDNIDPTPTSEIAAHIHIDRMGDRRILLLSLLRAAGLDAYPAAARPGNDFLYPATWDLPRRELFTIPMIRLSIPNGGVYWLDVRFDSLPFGSITDDLSGATVLTFLPEGPLFETLPTLSAQESIAYKERTLRLPGRRGEPLDITGSSVRRGYLGMQRGKELADADAEARRQMILLALYPVFPDAILRRYDVLRSENADASSQERYEITSATRVEERPGGTRAVPLCLLPPQVISQQTRNLTRRQTTCHITTVHMAEDRNVFILPEGASFTKLPRPAQIPSRFGVYQLRVLRRGDKTVEIIRNYHIPAQRIPPWDWADFLDFLERVELAEKQWIMYSPGEEK